MTKDEIKIGREVESLRSFSGVEKGTRGYIVEDYGTGITVAWALPDRPYPMHLTPAAIARMAAISPECPLRDGFDKETELQFLRAI